MDSKLKVWLESLSPVDRLMAIEKLGSIAVETADEKVINVIRRAAGLPELEEHPNEDKVEAAARKAAGLK